MDFKERTPYTITSRGRTFEGYYQHVPGATRKVRGPDGIKHEPIYKFLVQMKDTKNIMQIPESDITGGFYKIEERNNATET